jgi:hypothetical protein
MTLPELVTPDHRIAGAHSASILLDNVAFAAIEARLLGASPQGILGYRLPQVSATWSKRNTEISAIFPFSLVVESRNEPTDLAEAIADISIVMHLEYKLVEPIGTIPLEQLPHVIGTLGYMHAWPYFRADVQWLTTKLGFPALVLPVVLSGQIGDRVAIRRYPIGADGSPIIEAEAPSESPPVLPQRSSPAPKRPTKSRRKG